MSLNQFSAPMHKRISNYTINGKASVGAIVLSPSATKEAVTISAITVLLSMMLDIVGAHLGLNAIITLSVATIMAGFITVHYLRKTHVRIDGNTKEVSYYTPKPKGECAGSIENFSITEPRAIIIKVHVDGTNTLHLNTKKNTTELILSSKDGMLVFALAGKLKEMLGVGVEVNHID